MDNLLEALAKGINVSIDSISELLGSIYYSCYFSSCTSGNI